MVEETLNGSIAPRYNSPNGARRENAAAVFSDPGRVARFLGWFSVGLGAAELIAPGAVARIAGTHRKNSLVRFHGMRELAAGAGIFSQPNPAPWLWARVAGDVVDLASLAAGVKKGRRLQNIGSLAAVAGITALDVLCAQKYSARPSDHPSTEHAEASVLIAKTPDECYRFWRNLENLPRFVAELQEVRLSGEETAHFRAQIPGMNAPVEWDAEIIEDIPNERIAWRALRPRVIELRGSVTFERAPGDRGTFVRAQMDFDHPGRSVLSPAARLSGKHPEQIMYKSLRRLKQLLEVGEIITTEGQSAGRLTGTTWLDAMAR